MPLIYKRLTYLSVLFTIGFILCFMPAVLPGWQKTQVVALSPSSRQNTKVTATDLEPKAIKSYQSGRYTEAIALWLTALSHTSNTKYQAVIHSNLAQAYRQIGQQDKAILHWERVIQIYQPNDSKANRRLRAQLLTEQAQAYSTLGQHQRAIQLSQSALELARQNQDRATEAAALGMWANANWALGNYDPAIAADQASLKIASALQHPSYITTALSNLGNVLLSRSKRYQYQANVARLEGDEQEEARLTKLVTQDLLAAQAALERSALESKSLGGMAEARALLNLNHLLAQSPTVTADAIASNSNRILVLLEAQPNSRSKVYALINLAVQTKASEKVLLEKAIAIAKAIDDSRAESFALGTLGQMYESAG